MTETDHQSRIKWLASIEQVEALDSKIVVAGRTVSGTKAYIREFERAFSESHSAQEPVDKMMVMYGDLGNPYTLRTAAQAAFPQEQGALS